MFCRRREQLLDVTAKDVQAAAQKYLVDQVNQALESVVVLGEQKDWADPEDGWAIYQMSPETSASRAPDKVKL